MIDIKDPHAFTDPAWRPGGSHNPRRIPKETPMSTIADPATIEATRKAAVAIESAYRVRETQARLVELANQVGPTAEAAGMLRNEIRTLEAAVKDRDNQHKGDAANALDDKGKKLYSNAEARAAAVADMAAIDAEYQALAAELNAKRDAMTKADAAAQAITTEISALKSVAFIGGAALMALGGNAA